MARTFRTEWQQELNIFAPDSLCEIARSGPPQRPHDDPVNGAEPAHSHNELMRQRVWRAVTWLVFANVLAFWLLTCITAFTEV